MSAKVSQEIVTEMVNLYKARMEALETDEARQEQSAEIVTQIAAEFTTEERPIVANSVRYHLSKDGCYVKKAPAKKAAATTNTTKRVNKADAIATLTQMVEANACEVDTEILNKLTGKAAMYFIGVVTQLTGE